MPEINRGNKTFVLEGIAYPEFATTPAVQHGLGDRCYATGVTVPPSAGDSRVTTSANASSQVPVVDALLYSVARFSKKLACSTAFSISSSQGSGFDATWYSGLRPSCVRRRSAM